MKFVEASGWKIHGCESKKLCARCGEHFSRINFVRMPATRTCRIRAAHSFMNNRILSHDAVHQCDLHRIRSLTESHLQVTTQMRSPATESTTRCGKNCALLIKFHINFRLCARSAALVRGVRTIFHCGCLVPAFYMRWIKSKSGEQWFIRAKITRK